jgi:hypothetical protein
MVKMSEKWSREERGGKSREEREKERWRAGSKRRRNESQKGSALQLQHQARTSCSTAFD